MKDLFERAKKGVCFVVGRLRENMVLLFVVALVFGGAVKAVASQYVTVGYNDYLTEKQVGFDFVQMQKDVEVRKEEEAKKQAEQSSQGGAGTTVPVGGVNGN